MAKKSKNQSPDAEEYYFCLRLTADEHWIVENDIRTYVDKLNDGTIQLLELKYYRELKEGHVPMYREVKIVGEKFYVNVFKNWMKTDNEGTGSALINFTTKNPHKTAAQAV